MTQVLRSVVHLASGIDRGVGYAPEWGKPMEGFGCIPRLAVLKVFGVSCVPDVGRDMAPSPRRPSTLEMGS